MNYRWNFYEFVKTRGLGFFIYFYSSTIDHVLLLLSLLYTLLKSFLYSNITSGPVYGNLETSTTMMIIKIYGIDGRRWKQNQTLKSKRGLSSMRISADKIRDPYIILSVSKCNGTVFSILECKTTNLLVANTKERKKQFTIV